MATADIDTEQFVERLQALLLGMEGRMQVRFNKVDDRLESIIAKLDLMIARKPRTTE
jgi:hypothetical protein